MQLTIGKLLKVPGGVPNSAPLEFELGSILSIEERKSEVAYVNKETAAELMTVFNEAYCSVKDMMVQISYHHTLAKKLLEQRRAVLILDIVPDVLKQKGLATSRNPAGSEDLRQSVIDLDSEYSTLRENLAVLEAAYEFLNIKAKGFEMSYYSSRRILESNNMRLGEVSVYAPNDKNANVGNARF